MMLITTNQTARVFMNCLTLGHVEGDTRPFGRVMVVRFRLRALCAMGLCLFPLAFSPGCGAVEVSCAGTGVANSTATVSIDLGDLLKREASATLHVGDELYIGSNGCGDYGLPSSGSLAPTLVELSRHQQAGPGDGGGGHTLDVTYRASAPGHVVISISCRSESCDGAPIKIPVTVVASP